MGSTSKKKVNKQSPVKNYISWFEIPALNIERAVNFYNHIYQIRMEVVTSNGYTMAFFPSEDGIGGAVVMGEGCIPGQTGVLAYLNGGKDLDRVLGRVEEAGGYIVLTKTLITRQAGYFALFIDTEGNKLALHSKH